MIKGGVVGYIMDNHCSSFDEDEGWMLVWHHRHGMKLNTQRKGIFVGHFISLVKGYVEMCLTGFSIDSRTIKRSFLVS
jgi:hypothetical protein